MVNEKRIAHLKELYIYLLKYPSSVYSVTKIDDSYVVILQSKDNEIPLHDYPFVLSRAR